ncbi:MAG: PIN domain-containing protein [Nitrospirae bacterium]|nr:PIN domain-containing protein [Nitrospirota bacterium]MCL5237049.1 PIN domain-containing protein [Nitrospirota bacterium]
MPDRKFFDTNLWIYLFLNSKNPQDIKRKERVKLLLTGHTDIVVSTQVLNELANVLIKKYKLKADAVKEHLEHMLDIVEVDTLTENNTFTALSLLNKYNLSFYDAVIVSSALQADCSVVFSEDLQSNQDIEGKLKIVNPFAS